MADRIEREIEEILERLDDLPDSGRSPIPIASRKRKAQASAPARPSAPSLTSRVDPPVVMMVGAVVMIGGFVLATVVEPFIWLSFAGVVIFLVAFLLALTRSGKPKPVTGAHGVYWRDRYIEYNPAAPSLWDRMAGRFRRR